MDAHRFDTFTRSLCVVGSRRRAVVLALGGIIGMGGLLTSETVQAHDPLKNCKKKSGSQKKACLKKAKKHNTRHATDGGGGGADRGSGGGGNDGGSGGDSPVCQPGASESCYSGPTGAIGIGECRAGERQCQSNGTWGPCLGEVLPTAETCDGLDNDCDGVTDNGFDFQNDANNCGSCGETCDFPNATAKCDQGTCAVDQCHPGFVSCDPNAAGCETQLGTDGNCQGCGDVCDVGEHCGGIQAGCLPNTETNCSDGIDNDGDGNTDHADSDCPPVLQSVTVTPNNVPVGTATAQGTVQLSRAATSDTSVTLSLDKTHAAVPGSVTVAAGQPSGTFPVDGISPSSDGPVTLSATLGTLTKTETFHVVS